MAKKGKLEQNAKRAKLIKRYTAKRDALKAIMKNPESSYEDRWQAMLDLQKLPRNSSPNRYRNRCRLTGRPRGYVRKFQMSRIGIRDKGLAGEIPGLTKSSW